MDKEAEVSIGLFPLPLLANNEEREGLLVRRSTVCQTCPTQECLSHLASPLEGDPGPLVRICEQGLNYVPLGPGRMVRGILIDGWEPSAQTDRLVAKRFKRARKSELASVVRRQEFDKLISALRSQLAAGARVQTDAQTFRVAQEQPDYEKWARDEVRRATKGLSTAIIHDQRQLLASISQNAEYIMAQRYGDSYDGVVFPGENRISPTERRELWERQKAILVTCELLSERQKITNWLVDDPNLTVLRWSECRPHQIFHKYLKLCRSNAEAKSVRFFLGDSWRVCLLPNDLVSFPIQAVVDNALKYAPAGSDVNIRFQDSANCVVAIVGSYGPRIDPDERDAIFNPGTRGRHAISTGISGSGLGLWEARHIMRGWGSVDISQSEEYSEERPGFFYTQASLTFMVNASAAKRNR
jgi:signal transduction histidine kinase